MLRVRDVRVSFGGQDVLTGASFDVSAGERVGLVGANGVGKSTLLKVILGTIETDGGEATRVANKSIAYLPQDAGCASDSTLHAEMLALFQEVHANEEQQRDLERRMRELSADDPNLPTLVNAHARLQEEFERLGGYEVETSIGKVLSGLGFTRDDYDKLCCHFSGGWQMRIALAKLLLQSPDLLLLDEPTNHLDLEAIEWLENYLRDYRGALIVVSHDRFFLDRVTQRTLELEDGQVREWAGNYSFYIAAKETWLEQQESAYERQQVYLRQQQAYVERFRASARRSTQAKSREKMLDKLEKVERVRARRGIRFRFPTCRPSGREVLTLKGVTKSFDGTVVFRDCNLNVERGDRIALVGPNGAGKTTLLRLIVGDLMPDSGHIIEGHYVRRGYYAQQQADSLNDDATVFDEVYEAAPPEWTSQDVRDLLGAFLFSGDSVTKTVRVLSGGERSRIALAKMLLRPANLLLLDEPTNHLDIPAREMLESALQSYQGTVLLVSHDRYFISRVANKIVEVADEAITCYQGDYTYYREAKEKAAAAAAQQARAQSEERSNGASRKLATRPGMGAAKRALAAIEQEITSLEQTVRTLEQELGDPALYADGDTARQTVSTYEASKARLADLNSQWENLALTIESLQAT